jgi:hypothetical protein
MSVGIGVGIENDLCQDAYKYNDRRTLQGCEAR